MPLQKRNPGAGKAAGASESDHAAKLIYSEDNSTPDDKQDALPLIGANGRRYSEAVLRHWSPAAIRALGIRRADGGAL